MLRNVIAAARRQPEPPRLCSRPRARCTPARSTTGRCAFPTPEDTPLTVAQLDRPRTAYMLAKIYGEAMCHQARVPFTIVRPHNVYGPRMGLSHVIPELLQRAHAAAGRRRARPWRPSITGARSATSTTRSRCCGASRPRRRPPARRSTSAPSAPEVPIGELAAMIAATVGKRLEIVPLPATPGSPRRRCPDLTRTHRITGDAPRVDLASGLRRTYDWYRRHVFASEAGAPTAV